MTQQEEIIDAIKVLRKEVEVLTTRLLPAGTWYLHTAIDVINGRIDELIGEAITPYFDNPNNNLSPRKLAGKIFDEDVYDGYKEHTDAMELSRLREIQDKAAGRKPNTVRDAYLHSRKDDYEHTDEYYDTERNRSPNIQTMTSDASVTISPPTKNFISMKQKYGHAVLTVSEMMEEELDPLPINTFE